jgi:hypothetical protein
VRNIQLKPIIEDDKLRRGDKVLVFFNAPGMFCYILEREGHYFFYSVMMGKGVSVRYWYPESDHDLLGLRTVLSSLGFLEAPVFKRYEGDDSFRRIPGGRELLDNLLMYETDLAERKKAAEKQQRESEKKAKKEAKEAKKENNVTEEVNKSDSHLEIVKDQPENSQISDKEQEIPNN